jgi:hypothetical protein
MEQLPHINVRQAAMILEEYFNITVGMDFSIHSYCLLESNCPKAIELRKVLTDNSISIKDLEKHQETPVERLKHISLAQSSNIIKVTILGRVVEVDIGDITNTQIKEAIMNKYEELSACTGQFTSLGLSLYKTYTDEIGKIKTARNLTQLEFSLDEMKTYPHYLTVMDKRYWLCFPGVYEPQYIYTNGDRYEICEAHKKLLRRELLIAYTITSEFKIYSVKLHTINGMKFQHYHGNASNDCWGTIKLPAFWDRRLITLSALTKTLFNSLTTVNKDSLMLSVPPNFPDIMDLFSHSTKMGREGFPKEVAKETVAPNTAASPRPWGTGWRTT